MTNELQECMLKQIELTINQLKSDLDNYSSMVVRNSTNKSTKAIKKQLSNLAKLVDTLDILDTPLQCKSERTSYEKLLYPDTDFTPSNFITRV